MTIRSQRDHRKASDKVVKYRNLALISLNTGYCEGSCVVASVMEAHLAHRWMVDGHICNNNVSYYKKMINSNNYSIWYLRLNYSIIINRPRCKTQTNMPLPNTGTRPHRPYYCITYLFIPRIISGSLSLKQACPARLPAISYLVK